jgi:hypothetical protein
VPFQKCFRRLGWKGDHEAVVRLRQIDTEVMCLLFYPAAIIPFCGKRPTEASGFCSPQVIVNRGLADRATQGYLALTELHRPLVEWINC